MRNAWLKLAAPFGAVGALLLAMPGSAQTQMTAPPPSLMQSAPMAMPNPPQTQTPSQPAAPAASTAAPAQAQPTSAEPTQPTAPPKTVQKGKTKAKATAQAKKSAKTAKAKVPPSEAAAPAAEAAPPEATPPGQAKPVETKHAAKAKAAMTSKVARAPRDIVVAIYAVSAGNKGDYAGPSAFDNEKTRQLYFSKDLNAAIAALKAKSGGGPILNFDPITNSEAPDVQDLDIALESERPDQVIIGAKFRSAEDSSIVHYDFVKEGNAWKIDDIRGEIQGQKGQWSLREIIRNSLQRA